MNAALYLRISTANGTQDTANQSRQLRAFCESQGWPIVAVFEDHDSGSKSDRVQFLAMMEAAAKRKFDVLIFWSLDRLTREGALQTLQYLNRLTEYGVKYRSFSEPYLDSCGMFADAVVSILATIAKQERLRIQERINAGLARARENGTRSGKDIGAPKKLFDRAKAAEMRAAGQSYRKIADELGVGTMTVHAALKAAVQ